MFDLFNEMLQDFNTFTEKAEQFIENQKDKEVKNNG